MTNINNALVLSSENNSNVNDVKIKCIIRDFVENGRQIKKFLESSENEFIKSFMSQVSSKFGYILDTFTVKLEIGDKLIDLREHVDKQLKDICNLGIKNQFCIYAIEGIEVKKETKESNYEIDNNDDLPSNYGPVNSYEKCPVILPTTQFFSCNDGGFVGLVNQAMTCYLNSLLQSLFMTPEFRNAIYRWKYVSKDTEYMTLKESELKNIPYQLQRLFINMQKSEKKAVETTNLTKSFGWESSEAWQQHDVQELCRVMFDALEKYWADTDQANLINKLYQGYVKDYVRCLECGYESARNDSFLDIPLVIRPFGSDLAYNTIMDSLKAFVSFEKLEGTNQYDCGNCKMKRDAVKGLKFTKLPYLLTLQLKRFDFDYQTMHRIKLNDRMEFPAVLNLDSLLHKEEKELNIHESKNDSGDCNNSIDCNTINDVHIDSGDSYDQGCNVYELFSIMIHSGSAIGGHYYAYIKNFEDGQWYCFNDQHVSKIQKDDIEKTFGGTSFYSSSSANAYMLLYRRKNKKNELFLKENELPKHIINEIRKIKEEEDRERKERELDNEMIRVRAYCRFPKIDELCDMNIRLHRDKIWSEATDYVYEKFISNEEYIPKNRCRLVKFEDTSNNILESYELNSNITVGKVLGYNLSFSQYDVLLECRPEDEEFENFKPTGMSFRILVFDYKNEKFSHQIYISTERSHTVVELIDTIKIKLHLNCNQEDFRLACSDYSKRIYLIDDNMQPHLKKGQLIFVDYTLGEEDRKRNFTSSIFYSYIDRHLNLVKASISLPNVNNNIENEDIVSDPEDDELFDKHQNEYMKYIKIYDRTTPNSGIDPDSAKIEFDKRLNLKTFKMAMRDHINLGFYHFKVYRQCCNGQLMEICNLFESFDCLPDDGSAVIVLKPGRALREDEYSIKVFEFNANDEIDQVKNEIDVIVRRNITIKEMKDILKKKLNKSEPIENYRLRKKIWKSPLKIYFDDKRLNELHVFSSSEMYFEKIQSGKEKLENEISIYFKRYRPSRLEFDDFEEVFIDKSTENFTETFYQDICNKFNLEKIEFAKPKSGFPTNISVLEADNFNWLDKIPFEYIDDDGMVLFYRDATEQTTEVSKERRKEIEKEERAKSSSKRFYSGKKEKALKIYANQQ